MLGYIVAKLQFLGILWSLLNIVDLPVSGGTIALAWKHEVLAALWALVVGTPWWYFLGKGVASLLRKVSA
jgi:hypothetical protein